MDSVQTLQRMSISERSKNLKRKLLSRAPYKPEYEQIMDKLLQLQRYSSVQQDRKKVSQRLVEKIYVEMSKAQPYFAEEDPRLVKLKQRRQEKAKKRKSLNIRIKHRKEIDALVKQHTKDVQESSSSSDEETDMQKFLKDFNKEMALLSRSLGESVLEMDPKELLSVVASRSLLKAEAEKEKSMERRSKSFRRSKRIHSRYLEPKGTSAKADSMAAKISKSLRKSESLRISKKELGVDLIVRSWGDTTAEKHEESQTSIASKDRKSKIKESIHRSLLENTISQWKEASFMQGIKESERTTTSPLIEEHDIYFPRKRSEEATKREFRAAVHLREMDGRLQDYEDIRGQDNIEQMSMNSRTRKTQDRRIEGFIRKLWSQSSSKTPQNRLSELEKQLQTAGQSYTKTPWSADEKTSDQSGRGFKSSKSSDHRYGDQRTHKKADPASRESKFVESADSRNGNISDHWEEDIKSVLKGFSSSDHTYVERGMPRTSDDRERNIKSARPVDQRYEDRGTPKTSDDMERYFKPAGRKYLGRRICKHTYHSSIPTQYQDTNKQLAYQRYPKTQSPTESDQRISDPKYVTFSHPDIKEKSRGLDFTPPQKAVLWERDKIQPTRTDDWYVHSTKRTPSDQWEGKTPQKPEHWYPREGDVTLGSPQKSELPESKYGIFMESEKQGLNVVNGERRRESLDSSKPKQAMSCPSEEEILDTPEALKRAYNISARNEKAPWKIRQTTIDDVLAAKGFYPFIIKTQLPNTYYWRISKTRSLDDTELGSEMSESKPDLEVEQGVGKCKKTTRFLKKKSPNFLEEKEETLKEEITKVSRKDKKIHLVPKAKRKLNNINKQDANVKDLNEIEKILQRHESKLNTKVRPKRTISCYRDTERLGGKLRRADEGFESTMKVRGDFKAAPRLAKFRESIRERLVGKVKPQISAELKTDKKLKPDPKHVINIKLFGAEDRRPLICET